MPTTKRPTKKRKPRRTSDRVSRIAARLMRDLDGARPSGYFFHNGERFVTVSVADVMSVCASALNQDEHRGPRETKGRSK